MLYLWISGDSGPLEVEVAYIHDWHRPMQSYSWPDWWWHSASESHTFYILSMVYYLRKFGEQLAAEIKLYPKVVHFLLFLKPSK